MSLPTTTDISSFDIVTEMGPWINQVAKSSIDSDNTVTIGFPLYFAGSIISEPPVESYDATSFMIMF